MNITPVQLEKFKDLYRKHLGIELTDQEAREKATRLIQLLLVVDKPMTERDYKDATMLIKLLKGE